MRSANLPLVSSKYSGWSGIRQQISPVASPAPATSAYQSSSLA